MPVFLFRILIIWYLKISLFLEPTLQTLFMKKLKITTSAKKYFFEILVVAFGVFLGIIVSEAIATNKQNNQTEKSIDYIVKELKRNQEALESSIVYHEKLKISFQELTKDVTEEELQEPYFKSRFAPFNKIEGWKGPSIPKMQNSMYEAAKTANIFQNLDLENLQAVSRIYVRINGFNDFLSIWWNRFMMLGADTKTMDVFINFNILFSDILESEKNLSKDLEVAIDQLQKTD